MKLKPIEDVGKQKNVSGHGEISGAILSGTFSLEFIKISNINYFTLLGMELECRNTHFK